MLSCRADCHSDGVTDRLGPVRSVASEGVGTKVHEVRGRETIGLGQKTLSRFADGRLGEYGAEPPLFCIYRGAGEICTDPATRSWPGLAWPKPHCGADVLPDASGWPSKTHQRRQRKGAALPPLRWSSGLPARRPDQFVLLHPHKWDSADRIECSNAIFKTFVALIELYRLMRLSDIQPPVRD